MDRDIVRLGQRISHEREQRGWTRSDLARRAGLDPSYVSRIERATFADPSVEKVRAIADAMQLELTALTDPRPPDEPLDDALLRKLLARKLGGNRRHAEIVAAAIEAASQPGQSADNQRTILTMVELLLRNLQADDT